MLAGTCDQAYISLVENEDAYASIKSFSDKLEVCINGLLSGKLGLAKKDSHQHMCLSDIATIISGIDISNEVELTTRNILLNTIINSERHAAGSGIIAAITFLELRKKITYDDDLSMLTTLTHATNLKIAKQILKRSFGVDKKMYHMILKTCELAGHNGRVHINNIPKDMSYIEVTSGHRFNCHVHKEFEHTSKLFSWNRSSVKPFIIDGIIESISEVHHLLESMSKPKLPGVIFARGYAEEVIATLALNYKRETLDVIPVVVPYDLQGMNMLKDIAVVCGTDVVSSLKGELISCIDFDTMPNIEEIRIDKFQVNINHDPTHLHVRSHVDELRSRIEDEKNKPGANDKIQLINERIKALTSNCVEVSFGTEYSKSIQMNVHRFESGIQMIAEIARAGIIELDQSVNILKGHIGHPVFSRMLASKFLYVSAMAGLHGLKSGIEATGLINSIGAFIIRDR
jgi:hypothetical protein